MTSPRRRPIPFTSKIALAVTVIAIVGLFTYFAYLQNSSQIAPSILIDWRMKLTFNDGRSNTNYTLPAYIGSSSGAWSNHTLDAFGPSGYSPMSTRDTSSTIWIQSTEPAVFTFGDFFNVWGQQYNIQCVSYVGITSLNGTSLRGSYCSAPSEPVIYDVNNNNHYDPSTDINVSEVSDLPVVLPAANSFLSTDSGIMFISVNHSTIWFANETIVYDADHDGKYNPALDRIIHAGLNSTSGQQLTQDPRLKFYDSNGNGLWDGSIPPPVISDGSTERCLNRGTNLSNRKDWLLILWSQVYREVAGGCNPSG